MMNPPECVKSVGGQVVHFDAGPASSDLIITIDYPGLRPLAVPIRTGDFNARNPWALVFSLILMKPDAGDPWLEQAPPVAPDHGTVDTGAAAIWTSQGPARPDAFAPMDFPFGSAPTFAYLPDVHVSITPASGPSMTITSLSRLRFLSLPEGSAR